MIPGSHKTVTGRIYCINHFGQGVICLEMQFKKKEVACLRCLPDPVQELELTQELRIPEGMPGAQRIVSAWGQPILRGKEWQRDRVTISGGVQVWVLYEPEDESTARCLASWIPFRMDWDLPDNTPEGRCRVLLRLRFVDVRPVSAGKMMIRAGIAALGECWIPENIPVYYPEEVPGDMEILRSSWPVRMPREAGEKSFEMEETLTFPPSAPCPEQIIYSRMEPFVTDRKVLGNRVVFRGSGNLHVLYLCEDGQMHSWDFELPFSQYASLEESYSPDAGADVLMSVTGLELEPDGEGSLHLKAGLTGQYLVDDRQILETVEDAYIPGRELAVHREQLQLPVILDSRKENIYGEQAVPMKADVVTDVQFLPGFPRQRREGDQLRIELPGMLQVLGYDQDGKLRSVAQRWEGNLSVKADGESLVSGIPGTVLPQIYMGGEGITARLEVPVQITASAGRGMPMVTSLESGEKQEPDPARPSVILRRAGTERLWEIARQSGSTVTAIREANGLTGEPEPEKLLLIPVI